MSSFSADLAFRGLVHQVTDQALLARLDGGGMTGYIGFDPTADSLHVGHLLQVLTLRRLQLAGHRPIALAGGGTGRIGDPGGKSEERPVLDEDALRANLAGIRAQLARLLDFDGGDGPAAVLLDNGAWLDDLRLVDFLRDVGKHFSVNQMVTKESVRARLERPEQGISYTEFSYMLLQAYDFLHLYDAEGCELQLGASDQWGNITMGIELVRRRRGAEVYGLTTPLVLKADGTKFGKTESGTVWLDPARTTPYQLYQFLVRSDDAVVGTYLRYFTFLDHDAIAALDEATVTRPAERLAQRALAHEVCALVHGPDETARAETAARALYARSLASLDEATLGALTAEVPTSRRPRAELDGGGLAVVDVAVEAGLVRSKGEARRLVTQGGLYVNDLPVRSEDATVGRDDLRFARYLVLRKGRDYHLVCFE
ncbi:MAG TPA: tyrosine--tRNA ligase [Acidimicrobiales bacterium]|nr:tyrosine--tRNA ligase [Acidimicrobiales bacterium]